MKRKNGRAVSVGKSAGKSVEKSVGKERIVFLDYVRALAIIHVFLYHYYIEWFGGSFLIEPSGVARNIERLQTFQDGGAVGFVKNALSFLFAYGFFSVNVFLVLSGFLLSYSFYAGGEFTPLRRARDWASYYGKRFKRLLVPFYISVVLGAGFLFLRNILFPALGGPPLFDVFDALKLLFVPFIFYDMPFLQLFNGDYWFVPLILQLYLLFPLLYLFLKKLGIGWFLFLVGLACILFRAYAGAFLESVPMGVVYPAENSYRFFSFFLPRLFEFGFGMAVGYWYARSAVLGGQKMAQLVNTCTFGVRSFLVGSLVTLGGFALNMYSWGWAFSDPVVGIGLTLVFLNIGQFLAKVIFLQKWLLAISTVSYEIYLLHHYFLNYFLFPLLVTFGLKGQEWVFWSVMPLYFLAAVMVGVFGQWIAVAAERFVLRFRSLRR